MKRAAEAPLRVNQYTLMLVSSWSRSTTSSGSWGVSSVHSLNFSTIQASWPAGESVRAYASVCGRALAKLERVLPSRLRHRVNALRRWYLVAWDTDRKDWRTFRADRIEPRFPTGPRFAPRDPPDGDLATYLSRGVGSATWRYRARVRVHAAAPVVAPRLPPAVLVEAVDEHTCIVNVGSDTPGMLAAYVGMLEVDFEVTEPPELVEQLRTLASRYQRAVSNPASAPA
jgi:predicted DNA-binding transcriptional regulator YafY